MCSRIRSVITQSEHIIRCYGIVWLYKEAGHDTGCQGACQSASVILVDTNRLTSANYPGLVPIPSGSLSWSEADFHVRVIMPRLSMVLGWGSLRKPVGAIFPEVPTRF